MKTFRMFPMVALVMILLSTCSKQSTAVTQTMVKEQQKMLVDALNFDVLTTKDDIEKFIIINCSNSSSSTKVYQALLYKNKNLPDYKKMLDDAKNADKVMGNIFMDIK